MRSGQPGINGNEFKQLPVLVPTSTNEQTAIATVLSDLDTLISNMEKLIEKKRMIKQGVTQKFFTPKSDWTEKCLIDVADKNVKWSFTGGPFGSNLKFSDYTSEGIRVIQLQNIGDGIFHFESEVFTSEAKANELLSCNIYPGDIILSKMGDPVARACLIPKIHSRYLMCSDGIRLAINTSENDTYFILNYLNSPRFRTLAENKSTGSTRKRIGLVTLKKLKLVIPTKEIQNEIGNVLRNIDQELISLENVLMKYTFLKQGMMKSLLTGKIRIHNKD